ncbi:MAG: heavy-metal-associated domain-containing protein [Alphaproteobacteria bacterium]|nr:heavy-metal-associated domain-containing protein [Alphaproteobacteria bacterium]
MIFAVPDMSCGHCKSAIETAIAEAGGQVQVDLDAKRVTVTDLSALQAQAALEQAGFPATRIDQD